MLGRYRFLISAMRLNVAFTPSAQITLQHFLISVSHSGSQSLCYTCLSEVCNLAIARCFCLYCICLSCSCGMLELTHLYPDQVNPLIPIDVTVVACIEIYQT